MQVEIFGGALSVAVGAGLSVVGAFSVCMKWRECPQRTKAAMSLHSPQIKPPIIHHQITSRMYACMAS